MDKRNEALNSLMNVEFYPVVPENQNVLAHYSSFPLVDIVSLGNSVASVAAFVASVEPMLETLCLQSGTSGVLYKAVMNGVGMKFKDGVTLGNVHDASGKIIARTRFAPVKTNSEKAFAKTLTGTNVMIFMAIIAIKCVEKKVNEIKDIQKEIVNFLELDKQTKLQGDLNILADIMNQYKYHLDNDVYKTNKHIQVQEIKREAEQNILFYEQKIETRLENRDNIFFEKKVKERLAKIQRDMKFYQLAVYLYGFSSFLETVLLENYDSSFIESVTEDIRKRSLKYRELYTKCYNQLEMTSNKSVESTVLNSAAWVSGAAKKALEKTPVINKKIDQTLDVAQDKLEDLNKKKISWTMGKFSSNADSCVQPFIENLVEINEIFNTPMEVLIDGERVYYQRINDMTFAAE